MKRLLSLASLLTLAAVLHAAPEAFKIDPTHSSVGFSIRHFFSKVPGSFAKFEGVIHYDGANPEASSVEATVDVTTVDTRSQKRDDHLRSKDFFTVEQFPTATFRSKSWKKTGENTFDVTGDMTIKGNAKEIVLHVTMLGMGPGMKPGSTISGWEARTTLQRADFGITGFDKVLGADVDLTLNIEAGL
ncbi:MAG: polyisoprenoid-binding protein [Opitutus sp.]|nr:polyisoprenoid-binding protein [Opitutus sp.]